LIRTASLFDRQAKIYYLLCLPAIASEIIFSASIVANTQTILPSLELGGAALLAFIETLPWVLFMVSVYALVSFRPSLLVVLLTASFFVSAAATNGITFFGFLLSWPEAVSLLLGSSFAVLIGFNYSRGAKILEGRKLRSSSRGPLSYQILSISLELALPALAAIGLVVLVGAVFAALKTQVSELPQPLSTLSSLYLTTHVGSVFTIILIAGATIWVLRQLVEPVIMYYTINSSDARKLLMSEVEDIAKKSRKDRILQTMEGMPWVIGGAAMLLVMLSFLSAGIGPQGFYRALGSMFNLQHPGTTPAESDFLSSANFFISRIDSLLIEAENLLQTLIRLLWG
jgi:hypothetical protein